MDSDFKIFHCGYFLTIGEIFAVVTGEEKKDEIITEWFYLIKNKSNKIRGFILRSKNVFPTIESFWNSETLMNLKNAIYYDELWPSIKDRSDLYLYQKEISLTKMDKHAIFSINNNFPKFIKYIEKNTSCSSFLEYIKILKRIIIERKELSPEEWE